MRRGARFSADGRYRYRLWRRWDRALPVVAFCLLNPSTADARRDDPTIRRCIGFARTWGFGGVEVVNLFALRATDPRQLRRAQDPVGPRNDRAIRSAARRAAVVVLGWGAHPVARRRAGVAALRLGGARLVTLGRTRGGAPRHPLYLRADTRPIDASAA